MADGQKIELAKCYITIVPSLEGSQKTISQELGASAGEAAKEVGQKSGEDFGNAMATGLKATAAVVAAAVAAVTAAAVGVGKAFIDAANDVAEWGNTVDKESQKMNMTAAGYQEWAFILEHAGASIDGMKTAMKKLTVAAEEGNDAFTALGISQEDLANMTPEETWNATVAALQQVSDEGQRTALANELLGKGAVELAPLFNMTAEETAALKDQVYELGGVMSDDAVKAAAEYEDQLQNMKTSLTGLKNNIMTQFLPGMSSVMQGLSMIFSGQDGGVAMVQEGLKSISDNISELTPQLFELASGILTSLLESFAAQMPTLTTQVFYFLIDGLVAISELIPQLLPTIQTVIQALLQTVFVCLPLIVSSLLDLITDLATWLSSGDTVKTLVNGIVSLVSTIVTKLGLILPILLPAIIEIISEVATTLTTPENIQILLTAVLVLVGAILQALVNSTPEIIGYFTGLITNIIGVIKSLGDYLLPKLQSGWNTVVNICKSAGETVKTWLSGLIEGIKSGISNWLINLQNGFINAFNSISNWVGSIVSNIQGFVENCINTLSGLPAEAIEVGENLVKGLWEGISDKVDWVCEKIKGMGKSIEKAIKKTLGIASPSKVFAEIGRYTAEGFGLGFEDTMEDVEGDMVGQMDGLTASMSAEVSAYGAPGTLAGENTTYNGGAISINVYASEGQDVNSLAETIAEKLEDMTARKGAIYA